LAYFTAKYNLIYVYMPKYEGARMTHIVIDIIFVCLLVYQLTMLGFFGIKSFPAGSAIIALIALTCIFRYWIGRKFWKPSKYLPLEQCPSPKEDQVSRLTYTPNQDGFVSFVDYPYTQPSLIPLKPLSEAIKEPEMDRELTLMIE